MLNKEKIFEACLSEIDQRINFFQKLLNELSDGAKNDAKSSAGDKHETSLSMMQIEQEKIRKQLKEVQEMKAIFVKINPLINSSKINLGSVVQTNIGNFYIAVSIGKLNVNNTELFVISQQSPIANKLLGLTVNDQIELNARKIIIQAIF
jgi:transcription elongation GreA/GreB family factor